MGYHVWKYTENRLRMLALIETRNLSRWDDCNVPAYWEKRSAANAWLRSQKKEGGQAEHGGMVLQCDCHVIPGTKRTTGFPHE